MLDSYEENEFIWDESDTRLTGFGDHGLVIGPGGKRTVTSTSSDGDTIASTKATSNSSLEKSLSLCFSDLSSINGPVENVSETNSEFSHHVSTSDLTNEPVIDPSIFDDYANGQTDLGPVLNLEFDFNVSRSINGVSRLTPFNPTFESSSSLYSFSGDRRSKSYGNLRELDQESRTMASANLHLAKWTDDTINCSTPRKAGYRVIFEIISARTVTTGAASGVKNRYVCYTIIIKRCPGLESQPGVIERRYTEFSALYTALLKRYPMLLRDFTFPKKTLVGNFTSQVIRERSIAFQSLLTYCLSVDELRVSRPFIDFLHSKEMMDVRRALKSRNFEEAGNLLENCYFIQEKITFSGANDQSNAQVYQILILLVTSMKASGSLEEALTYAEKVIPMILETDHYDRHELTVPFIHLLIQLNEYSGRSIDAFESKLTSMREKGIQMSDKLPNLIDLIVRKDYTNLSCLRF